MVPAHTGWKCRRTTIILTLTTGTILTMDTTPEEEEDQEDTTIITIRTMATREAPWRIS
jgi:hypothetical protein